MLTAALRSIPRTLIPFPEIAADDTLDVIVGKINKWQQDALKKIENSEQSNMIQAFPDVEFDPEDRIIPTMQIGILSGDLKLNFFARRVCFDEIIAEDETTKKLRDEIISALLAYTMNEKILKVVSDHGELVADYALFRPVRSFDCQKIGFI